MNPTEVILTFSRIIWPVGIVLAPLLLWFAGRRAIAHTANQPPLHPDIRRAAAVLAVLLSGASALATLVQLSYPDITPLCLLQSPLLEPPALYLICIGGIFLIALVIWVVAGAGARQLGVLGGALAKRGPYPERLVRWAITLYVFLSPVFIYVGFSFSFPHDSLLCSTA